MRVRPNQSYFTGHTKRGFVQRQDTAKTTPPPSQSGSRTKITYRVEIDFRQLCLLSPNPVPRYKSNPISFSLSLALKPSYMNDNFISTNANGLRNVIELSSAL